MQQCTELNVTNRPRAYPERGGRVGKIRMECRREKVSVFGFEGTPSEKQQSMTEAEKSEALRSKDIFLDSSMVEHSAVNRVVVGSSPTRGA